HYAVSRAFDFAGVKRLSFSILEPAVPVHPTLVLDMAAVALPGCANATSISPPAPPAGTSGGFIKHWYMCNRAELAVVYSGEKDTDPTVHYSWAQQFEDRPLYSEIMLLREALSSGVRGSADRPFEAFLKWKSAQGK
ncbi:MAG TPA: hypothetical protein VJ256_04135, partial [Dehalococcoidia bacterium]|nr:hypothetical protein [Dehalococcoidia bacterium]